MNRVFCLTMIIALFLTSCSGTRKNMRNKSYKQETATVAVTRVNNNQPVFSIKEVEERVVSVSGSGSDRHRYYVIIGSFRYIENAMKHQKKILDEGFTSELLRNESGLYRVSVLSTDDITAARDDIRRIRTFFPAYYDTWLLIQMR